MPAEFDWRDLPHAEHENRDPLARFRPEKLPASAPQHPQHPSWSRVRRVVGLLAIASAFAFAAAYVWSRRAAPGAQAPPVATVATTSVEREPPPSASPRAAGVAAPTSSARGASALPLAAEG